MRKGTIQQLRDESSRALMQRRAAEANERHRQQNPPPDQMAEPEDLVDYVEADEEDVGAGVEPNLNDAGEIDPPGDGDENSHTSEENNDPPSIL